MPPSGSPPAKTFVLVHGAHHGGWCYGRVAALLRAGGHGVYAPTLSGLAERSREAAPGVNLTTHIADIVDLFRWEELDDVVLCGHSYGGMVVGGVADRIPDRIRNLVFLDAVVPEDGRSMMDHAPVEVLLGAVGAAGAGGGGWLLPAPPASFFGVNEADRPMVERLMTPHPLACLIEPARLGAGTDTISRHTYIFATRSGFPMIVEQYESAKTRPGWEVLEVEAGHDVMIDAPERLAEILTGLD